MDSAHAALDVAAHFDLAPANSAACTSEELIDSRLFACQKRTVRPDFSHTGIHNGRFK
jgi:hypothetical protein